jgi:two-component system CheB/CheR fusion protein
MDASRTDDDRDRPMAGLPLGDLLGLWHAQSEDFALIFMAADATVVACNGAVSRILGYEPEELRGDTLRRIFTEEDRARGLDLHELEVASQTGRAEDDRWHVRKGGRRVWISGVLAPLADAAGRPLGFVKLLRDRTDLKSQIESLENQVAAAEAAAARKDAFLATLGHELRNPLNTLGNAFTIVRRTQAGPGADRIVSVIERQLAALERMVDDLRDAVRVDTGALALKIERIELQSAIRSAIALHEAAARERSLALRAVLPQQPIALEADAQRLEQILRNLIDNAIKYSHPGGVVDVTATVEGRAAVIRVEDDGMGMSAEVLPRIFELFTREDRAVASATEGLGIGLALVKNLVRLHHGIVEVQSAGTDRGSEFTLRLPLEQPKGPA